VQVPTTLVAFDRDQIVPPALVAELAAALPRLERHVTIESRFGHDGFLKEPAALRPVLRQVLR
jgi:homoserine O-acetyltransferase